MDEKTRLAAELAAQMIAARAFSPTYSVNLLREGKDPPEDVVRAALDGMAFGTGDALGRIFQATFALVLEALEDPQAIAQRRSRQ